MLLEHIAITALSVALAVAVAPRVIPSLIHRKTKTLTTTTKVERSKAPAEVDQYGDWEAAKSMELQMARLDERQDAMEKRLDRIEGQVGDVNAKVGGIDANVNTMLKMMEMGR